MINAIDMETGEIVRENIVNPRTQKEQEEYEKYNRIKHASCNEFFFMFYGIEDINESPLSKLNTPEFARMVYLSSYCDYNTNRLLTDKGTPIDFTMLKFVMLLSTKQFYEFRNKILELELVSVDNDGCLKLSEKYFHRGRLKKGTDNHMKVYIDAIRTLYENNPRIKDKCLGYVYRLIPYINRTHHFVCFNPYEKDLYKLNLLTSKDFCDIIGADKSNSQRVIKYMQDIKIQGQYLVALVANENAEQKVIITNPRLFSISECTKTSSIAESIFSKIG